MKNFLYQAIWVVLAGICGVATVSVVPMSASLVWESYQGQGASALTYKMAAVGGVAEAQTQVLKVNPSVNDPVFVPPLIGKVIRADLTAMKLSLYENGNPVATYDIVAKGRPGSAWETPTGEYRILTKEENHYSSMGEVYMPWSMQFFGNFFIHGRPYDDHGKEVSDTYSGGCIRLSTPDAEEVYKFADHSTLVSVYGGVSDPALSESYRLLSSQVPGINAKAYAVVDLATGEVIISEGLDNTYPIASISKLLTALVSLEVINQSDLVTISRRAVDTYGTQGNLSAGEVLPAKELLYPLLLESSNDAAEALAEHYGREAFIKRLNEKSIALGLTETHFDDPSGLSAKNTSSVRDLARLAKYIYTSKRYLFDLTRQQSYSYAQHHWVNSNKLVGEDGYLGGKNGFIDESLQTQIALFELPLSEFTKRDVAIVVLRSVDRQKDVNSLVKFIKTNAVFSEEPKNSTWEYL